MRYEGKRKSRKDNQVDVYSFTMGIDEVNLIQSILAEFLRKCPRIIETSQATNRVSSILAELRRFKHFKDYERREPTVPENVTPN